MTWNRDVGRQWLTVVSYLATIGVNALANALPINGNTTGELADRYPVAVQPAGYAFSIWSLIYLALGAFAVYQAQPAQRENPRLRRIAPLFLLTCAGNIAWILLWHYERVPMLGLLAALIAIYVRLNPWRERLPLVERWVVALPFSLYLGWITVASLVNVAVVVYDVDTATWQTNATAWSIALLAVAGVAAAAVGLLRADVAFAGVIVWAAAAIVVNNDGRPVVAVGAAMLAAVALATLGAGYIRARNQGRHVTP
jgi:translocator protein